MHPKHLINQTSICFQIPVECALIGGVDGCIVSRASHSCLSHTHYIAPGNTHTHMHTKMDERTGLRCPAIYMYIYILYIHVGSGFLCGTWELFRAYIHVYITVLNKFSVL